MLLDLVLNKIGIGTSLLGILGALIATVWKYTWERLKAPDKFPGGNDRSRRLEMLQSDTAARWYRGVVSTLLDAVSKFFQDQDDFESGSEATQPDQTITRVPPIRSMFDGTNPWTMKSYTYCLSLSFIYPVFGFLVPWLFGADGSLASLRLLPNDQPPALRLSLVVLVAMSCITGWMYSRSAVRSRTWKLGAGWLLTTAAAVILAYALSFPVIITIGIASISAIAAVQAQAFSTLTTGALFAFLVASLFYVGRLDIFLPLAIAGVVFMLLQVFWHWFWTISSRKVFAIVLWQTSWVFVIIAMIAGLSLARQNFSPEAVRNTQIMLLFFVLFPLINSPLDWVSLGLTRGLLAKIREGSHKLNAVWWALLDVLFAAVFYALMVGIIIITLSVVDIFWTASSGSSLQVAAFLRRFAAEPWAVSSVWIHVMAAATLVPTVIHFFLASFATVYIVSATAARPVFRQHLEHWPKTDEVDGDRLLIATALYVGNLVIGIIFPIFFIYAIFSVLFQGPVEIYIRWVAEALASVLQKLTFGAPHF
jgi:hypothetical protein